MVFSFLFCIFATKIVLNKQNMKQFSLGEYLKNPLRKVVTRDGRAVKIYCTDYIDGPIIAKIEEDAFSLSFREDGRYFDFEETDNDLFFAPEKHEGWINLYRDRNMNLYTSIPFDSEEAAINFGRMQNIYIKTIKIEWEE